MAQLQLESQRIKEESPDSLKLSPEGELEEQLKISAENNNPKKKLPHSPHSKETEQGRSNRGNAILITEKEEMETDVDVPSIRKMAAESLTEATTASLGLVKGHQQHSEDGDEKSILSKLNDSVKGIEDNVLEVIASVEDYFSATPEKAESGKSLDQRTSDGIDGANLKLGESCAHIEPESVENPAESSSDVQSQGLVGKTRKKVNEVVGSLSESLQTEPIAEMDELASDQQYPNFTEEVMSGASEIGSILSGKASGLIQRWKDILTFDRSSTDNTRDTVTEGEYKEKEDKGTQQPTEAAVKASRINAEKEGKESMNVERNPNNAICPRSNMICNCNGHHADDNQDNSIASKSDYGGKTIQKNVTKSRDQIQHAWNEAETNDIDSVTSESKDSISGGCCRGSEKAGITPPSKTDGTAVAFKSSSPNPSGVENIVGQVSGVVSSFPGRKQGILSFQQPEPMTELQKQEPMAVIPKPELQIQGPIE